MKKTFVLALAAVSLCLALCGCGDYRVAPESGAKEPDIVSTPSPMLPETSPMITPDVNDGIVKDTDGEIEDHDTGSTPGSNTTKKPAASPATPSSEPNKH